MIAKCKFQNKSNRNTSLTSNLSTCKLLSNTSEGHIYSALLLIIPFYHRCETYTQALIERTMTKYPKYLVVHRSGAKSLPLSFVITIRNVSFHIIKIFLCNVYLH